MVGSFQRHGLRKAGRILGGEAQLRAFLDVSPADLSDWLRGAAPVPEAVFRRIVVFLADREEAAARQQHRPAAG